MHVITTRNEFANRGKLAGKLANSMTVLGQSPNRCSTSSRCLCAPCLHMRLAAVILIRARISYRLLCRVRDCLCARAVGSGFRRQIAREVPMFKLTSLRRMFSQSPKRLIWGAMGFCSMAMIVAVSAGMYPAGRARDAAVAPEDGGSSTAAEAPAGFDHPTHSLQGQPAVDKGRCKFEGVEE